MAAKLFNIVDLLNRAMPVFSKVKLGSTLADLIASHNALLLKLDADTGVASTDYLSALRVKTLDERI